MFITKKQHIETTEDLYTRIYDVRSELISSRCSFDVREIDLKHRANCLERDLKTMDKKLEAILEYLGARFATKLTDDEDYPKPPRVLKLYVEKIRKRK